MIAVTAGSGYSIGSFKSATGTIRDDDNVSVTVAVAPASVPEDGPGTLAYTFARGRHRGGPDGELRRGRDGGLRQRLRASGAASFGSGAGTVTFAAGTATAVVTLDPIADGTAEASETVVLTLASGAGYAVGSPAAATGTIANDDTVVSVAVAPGSVPEDGPGTLAYTFTRAGSTIGALTVGFAVGGGAGFGSDYAQSGAASFGSGAGTVTFAAGTATAVVTLDPIADGTAEASETVVLTLASGTATPSARPPPPPGPSPTTTPLSSAWPWPRARCPRTGRAPWPTPSRARASPRGP